MIGGGDWANNRLVPDIIRSFQSHEDLVIRYPDSVRPWQHVLEPLYGYILLAEKLLDNGPEYAKGWNFGPSDQDARPVWWIVEKLSKMWGTDTNWILDKSNNHHESKYLKLDCTMATSKLGWKPKWDLQIALQKIVDWHTADISNARKMCVDQIDEYMG